MNSEKTMNKSGEDIRKEKIRDEQHKTGYVNIFLFKSIEYKPERQSGDSQ